MAFVRVVEDDTGIAAMLREILSDEGYTVVTVPDASTGLLRLRTLRPALISTDLRLP